MKMQNDFKRAFSLDVFSTFSLQNHFNNLTPMDLKTGVIAENA